MSARVADEAAVLTVARGLQVLRAFRSERSPVSNAELARRTGLSKSTVSKLTSTLLQLGFIGYVPGGRQFELAPRPLGTGHAFIESSALLHTVHPLMQELADRLGVSTALAVPDGIDMLYIACRSSSRGVRLHVGSVLPIGTTAIGRACLWAMPANERGPLIARLVQHAGPHGDALEEAVQGSFVELDDTGTCCMADGVVGNTFSTALPVRVGRQDVLMGLSCGKAVEGADLVAERKRIGPAMKQAAEQFVELLAHADGRP